MNSDLIKTLESDGYANVRALEDGTVVGTIDLMFTRAIFIDLDYQGWGKRFCFKDRDLADSEVQKLKTGDDEPVGYIARRNG